MLSVQPPADPAKPGAQAVDLARITPATERGPENVPKLSWHGTILPATDADLWLAAAFADYERIVARERAIKAGASNGRLGIRARERLALAYAILLPPVLVLVFVAIMVFESDYTHLLRVIFFMPTT